MLDLFRADTSVLSEELERLGVIIQSFDVGDVFVDGVESLSLRSTGEEDGSVSTLDGVLLGRRLVVWGRLDLLNVTCAKRSEERLINLLVLRSSLGSREIWLGWLWGWFRGWLSNWLFNGCIFFSSFVFSDGLLRVLSLSALLLSKVSLHSLLVINEVLPAIG